MHPCQYSSGGGSVRQFGLKGSICIIPNGVDLPQPCPSISLNHASWNRWKARGGKVLLYPGRFTQKRAWKGSSKAGVPRIWQKRGIGA